MKIILNYWSVILFLLGSIGTGVYQGYCENKLAPAVIIVMVLLVFLGFGLGASIKGLVDLFGK